MKNQLRLPRPHLAEQLLLDQWWALVTQQEAGGTDGALCNCWPAGWLVRLEPVPIGGWSHGGWVHGGRRFHNSEQKGVLRPDSPACLSCAYFLQHVGSPGSPGGPGRTHPDLGIPRRSQCPSFLSLDR